MKTLIIIAVVLVSCIVQAGAFMAYLKMHDGKILQLELSSIPTTPKSGFFHFKNKELGENYENGIWVHCSNVWFVKK